jgi:hypothetical protein
MNTPVKWNASASRLLHASTKSRWWEVLRGLKFLVAGYLALFVLAVPGLFLWTAAGGAFPTLWRLGLEGNDGAEFLGLIMGCTGALFASVLIVIGQWWCLCHAPQGHSAKDLLFAAILTALLGIPLALAAPLLGTDWDLRLLERLWDAVEAGKVPAVCFRSRPSSLPWSTCCCSASSPAPSPRASRTSGARAAPNGSSCPWGCCWAGPPAPPSPNATSWPRPNCRSPWPPAGRGA